jgi:Tfp pilus assembly protein PilX
MPDIKRQHGSTLVSVLIIIMIVGIMAAGSIDLSHVSEKSAGNAIQRSRAFQAADGGAAIAQASVLDQMQARAFADSTASEGIFSTDSYQKKWWRTATYTGEQLVPAGSVLGVAKSPRYIVEEVGHFVTDGGTGISSLDLGSASYGSRSRSGRDVVLYRIESHGTGSFSEVRSVVETIVAFSY